MLMRAGHAEKVLFLVDRMALREQALVAFKEHMPNEPRWPNVGEKLIATDRRVYVATYPPVELQDRFGEISAKVEGAKSCYQQSLTDLETLYGALSQQAFKGELDLSRVPMPDIKAGEEKTMAAEPLRAQSFSLAMSSVSTVFFQD
jgi:hypothetical protein